MPSNKEKLPQYGKKQLEHVMVTAALSIYHSTTGFVEHSDLYSRLKQELFFTGKQKIQLFEKGLRALEKRGWIEPIIQRNQIPPVLVFKLTPRSKIIFDLIKE